MLRNTIYKKKAIRFIIGALLTSFIFISCENKNNFQSQNNSLYSLASSGFKSIKIDTLTTNKPYSIQYYNLDGKDVLTFINFHFNEVQLYDLNSGRLIKKLKFDPNFFGKITGY